MQFADLHRQTLLLLRHNKSRQLPGVAPQLRVSELVEGSNVRQLPLRLHQQGQMLRVHFVLPQKRWELPQKNQSQSLPITCWNSRRDSAALQLACWRWACAPSAPAWGRAWRRCQGSCGTTVCSSAFCSSAGPQRRCEASSSHWEASGKVVSN